MLRFLQDIIVSLVEESSTLPDGVLDCLLGQVKGNKDVRGIFQVPKPKTDFVARSVSSYQSLPLRRAS